VAPKIPSEEQVLSLLDLLEQQPASELENEVLDFKTWENAKQTLKIAKEMAVCFANASGGLLVFGIDDKQIGRKQAIHGCKNYDLDQLQRDIYDLTRPNLTVEVFEVLVPEGKLILIRIPKGPKPPYATAQGLYQKRVGKNCMPLFPEAFQRTQVSVGAIDWSAETVSKYARDLISESEIVRLRDTLRANKPDSDWIDLSNEDLLDNLGVVRDGKITNAGLLLVGQPEVVRRVIPNQEVIYLHLIGDTETDFRLDLKEPLLSALDKLISSINVRNPIRTIEGPLFHLSIPDYPERALRESILNAMIHRDYLEPGSVYVRHYEDSLQITNPGGFIGGITPENILHAEAKQRNRLLAEMFQQLGLVDRVGFGRSRIFKGMLTFGKATPSYEATAHTVRLTLYGSHPDEAIALFIADRQRQGYRFQLDELLILPYLKEHSDINLPEAVKLCQRPEGQMRDILEKFCTEDEPWLERRGSTYHLTRWAASAFVGKAFYTLNKSIDVVQWPALVMQYVEHHNSISNRECRELLRLGNSTSAQTKVSAFLSGLDFLEPYGDAPKNRRYKLKNK
jgi:ATP-dependent DNA helicase RecG